MESSVDQLPPFVRDGGAPIRGDLALVQRSSVWSRTVSHWKACRSAGVVARVSVGPIDPSEGA